MKEITVSSWDDLDLQQGQRTPASTTVTLSLDGRTVELDLHGRHVAELTSLLAPYFDAGRKPDQATLPGVPRKGTHRAGIRAYNKAMRAWGEANGYPVHTGYGGKPYHSTALREAYAAYLQKEARGGG